VVEITVKRCPFCESKRFALDKGRFLCLRCGANGENESSIAVTSWIFSITEKDWEEYQRGRRFRIEGGVVVVTNKQILELEGIPDV